MCTSAELRFLIKLLFLPRASRCRVHPHDSSRAQLAPATLLMDYITSHSNPLHSIPSHYIPFHPIPFHPIPCVLAPITANLQCTLHCALLLLVTPNNASSPHRKIRAMFLFVTPNIGPGLGFRNPSRINMVSLTSMIL